MLTKGIIMSEVPDSGGYKWKIYIPTLVGLPDSVQESYLFKAYKQQQELQQTNTKSEESSTLERFLIALRGKIKATQSTNKIVLTDQDKRFTIDAEVCGLCGTKVDYQVGDIVVVGFIDNVMSQPIIIGTYMTEMLSNNRITRPQIKATSLSVEQQSTLPSDTTIKAPDGGNITTRQIYDALQFINNLQDRGLSLSTVSQLVDLVAPVGGFGDSKIQNLYKQVQSLSTLFPQTTQS